MSCYSYSRFFYKIKEFVEGEIFLCDCRFFLVLLESHSQKNQLPLISNGHTFFRIDKNHVLNMFYIYRMFSLFVLYVTRCPSI